jgi:diacylglycerol kinase family enzyme
VRKARISEALALHGYGCRYLVTSPEESACHFAEQAIADGADLVGVSGGDGTVMEAITALIGTGIPLAIFPAGTGNLLSVNLNLPHEVPQSVDAALNGTRKAIDLAQIVTFDASGKAQEPRHFAILAGAGYDADVILGADRAAKNRLGMGAYLLSALRNLGRRRAWASVRIDGAQSPMRRRVKSVMVANMGRLQGNLEVIPDATPDDGILDVAMLKAETLRDWVRLAFAAIRRRLRDDAAVEYYQARSVEVRFASPQPIQLDGEALEGEYRGFQVKVVPNAVEVMVPRNTPIQEGEFASVARLASRFVSAGERPR